jgi:hypothetical protein
MNSDEKSNGMEGKAMSVEDLMNGYQESEGQEPAEQESESENEDILKEQFDGVLADFGKIVGTPLSLDDDGTATFTVDDDIIVNLQYLAESDCIIAFSPVGGFGETDAPDAGKKALALLRMNEIGGPTEGFTLALDEDAELVLAMDRRSALEISSADSLAAWMEALVNAVRAVRTRFAEEFPINEEGRE